MSLFRRLPRWTPCRSLLLLGCFAWGHVAAPKLFAAEPAPQNATPTAAKSSEQGIDESWDVIHIGNERVGYAHSITRPTQRDGRKILQTEVETSLTLKRFGQTLKMQTRTEVDETPEGELLSYQFEMKNPPNSLTRTTGHVEGGLLKLETTIAGVRSRTSMNWDAEIKSPTYQDRLIREKRLRPGDSVSFKTFVMEFSKVATVKIDADDFRYVKLLDGKQHKLLKVTITQSILPTMPVRAFLDDAGDPLTSVTEMPGQSLTTYRVDAAEALKEIAGGELDLAVNSLVKLDKPLANAHRTKRVVYRVKTPGEDPTKQFVTGPTQSVKSIDAETAEITVTAITPTTTQKTVRVEPEYLSPTLFLQANDPAVRDHAERAVGGEIDPVQIALKMEKYIHENLKKKNFSTALATASEVAKSLEGDCTEHAVLLAAMLRVKKIPSRVVVGMVYAPSLNAFGGHMWTEAFLGGEWVPLDATLGQGGIGAGHLKMAESSLADNSPTPVLTFVPLLRVLGKMSIEVIESQ